MITISSAPARKIDKEALFTVTTSLVEGSSYNNVRIRAEVYFEGEAKAIIEKPKGLSVFDFSEILKTMLVGFKKPRYALQDYETGSVSAQLITALSVFNGTWDTLSTTGNVVNSAICTADCSIVTNSVSMLKGELYMLVIPNMVNTGTRPQVRLTADTGVLRAYYSDIYGNKVILLMPMEDSTSGRVVIGNMPTQNWSGTVELRRIQTDRATVGQMLVPYFVNFTEVYEDSAGVTQEGGEQPTEIYRYVPMSQGITITDYLLSGTTSRFANLSYRAGASKYVTLNPVEQRLVYFTEYYSLQLYRAINGGALTAVSVMYAYEGWGVIFLDPNTLSGITSQAQVRVNDGVTSAQISEVLTIVADGKCSATRVVLECTGLAGGSEVFVFEGEKSSEYAVTRSFWTDYRGVRHPVRNLGVGRYKIGTKFQDMYTAEYLIALMVATDAKMLLPDAEPIPVTVIADTGKLETQSLYTNEFEIEYDYGY